jgi:anti-anti-sigma factor
MTHGSELPAEAGARRTPPVALAAALLQVEVSQPRSDVCVVSPAGEVDAATADVLRDAIRDAAETGPRCLVVDLSGLTFCGSTGLVVLLEASRAAEAAGAHFGTVAGRSMMRRILDITGLRPVLGHRETLEDVLGDLDG